MAKFWRRAILCVAILGVAFLSLANQAKDSPPATDNPIKITLLDSSGKRVLGTVTTKRPERYAVIRERKAGAKASYLYKQGDYILNRYKILAIYNNFIILSISRRGDTITLRKNARYKDIEFVKAVMLDTFEYRYRITGKINPQDEGRFKLVDIKGGKATLERPYKEEFLKGTEGLPVSKFLKEAAEETFVDIFLDQLRTKKMGDGVWMVDGKSVSKPVVESTGKALLDVAKNVKGAGFGKNGLKLRFESKSASGILDRNGFLADYLSPDVRYKAGLLEGDIIKTINGRHIYNMIDIIWLFLEIKHDNVSEVNVQLLRNGQMKALTYIIR